MARTTGPMLLSASESRVRLRPGRELPGGPGLRISDRPDVGPVTSLVTGTPEPHRLVVPTDRAGACSSPTVTARPSAGPAAHRFLRGCAEGARGAGRDTSRHEQRTAAFDRPGGNGPEPGPEPGSGYNGGRRIRRPGRGRCGLPCPARVGAQVRCIKFGYVRRFGEFRGVRLALKHVQQPWLQRPESVLIGAVVEFRRQSGDIRRVLTTALGPRAEPSPAGSSPPSHPQRQFKVMPDRAAHRPGYRQHAAVPSLPPWLFLAPGASR